MIILAKVISSTHSNIIQTVYLKHHIANQIHGIYLYIQYTYNTHVHQFYICYGTGWNCSTPYMRNGELTAAKTTHERSEVRERDNDHDDDNNIQPRAKGTKLLKKYLYKRQIIHRRFDTMHIENKN